MVFLTLLRSVNKITWSTLSHEPSPIILHRYDDGVDDDGDVDDDVDDVFDDD